MKKTVQFHAFGRDTDYLVLNLKDLLAIETVTGLTIIEVWKRLINSQYSLNMLYQILPIAYKDCAAQQEEKINIDKRIEEAIDSGKNISALAFPIATAIVQTGIFGTSIDNEKN